MLLPYYHIVSDERVPHVSPLYRFRSVREFRNDLDWFLKHRTVLSLSDFLAVTTKDAPPPANAFFLTFDDGFREVFDVVRPILREKGVPAFFFVTSGTVDNKILCLHQKIALILNAMSRKPVELAQRLSGLLSSRGVHVVDASKAIRSLTYSQNELVDEAADICGVDIAGYLKSVSPFLTAAQISVLLADGFGIGSHSIDHPLYSRLSYDEQIRQTKESMGFFSDRFSLPYRLFAFPHSDSSVSAEFFKSIHVGDAIQATFGTSAPHVDCVPKSFQRFSMEKTRHSAATIVALQSIRRLKQKLTGRTLINRP